MIKFKITLTLLMLNLMCYSQVLDYPQHINEDNQIIKHKAYILSYNETCEQANWVKYMVTKVEINSSVANRKNNFKEDDLIPTGSAKLSDYKGSGYDRGHLAPAAVFTDNQDEIDESFYMSNISPQHPSFNRGIWNKLEAYERSLAIEHDTIYVITGGILKGELKTIGESEVCVPKLFFKIIYNKDFIIGFILRNMKLDDPLLMYKFPIDIIERETGLKFILH